MAGPGICVLCLVDTCASEVHQCSIRLHLMDIIIIIIIKIIIIIIIKIIIIIIIIIMIIIVMYLYSASIQLPAQERFYE